MAAALSFASASLAESATAAPQLASPALAVKAGRQRGLTCGVVGLCEHGRQRSRCKECGGSGICEHGRMRSTCEECDGHVLVTLEATAVEGCEGEEEDARVSVFLPVEGGQVVWSVANYSGLVDSQTALS